MMKKLKIGYFGDGPWAHNAFEALHNDPAVEIRFICVRNDSADEVLNRYAVDHGIDFLKHPNVNAPDFLQKLKEYDCDLFVSMSFNQIFRKDIINLPPLKSINCHAGKLPFYRGRNILNWALINDEKEFGITVHYMDEGIDTGDIILQRTYPISDNDDYATLLELAHKECAVCLYDAIHLIVSENAPRIKQSTIDPVGFYCGARKQGDEIINWNQTSREIFNFIRSICDPGPVARTFVKGAEVKIRKAEQIHGAPEYKGIPGQVLVKSKDFILVKTIDSTIRITEWDAAFPVRTGDRFTSEGTLTKKLPLILIGGGGHCKSCIDIVEAEGTYSIEGILDVASKKGTMVHGYKMNYCDDDFELLSKKGYHFLITVGQIKSSDNRRRLFGELKKLNAKFATIISPSSVVSPKAIIGEGSVIMHGVHVNAGTTIGVNAILNTGCLVEHDNSVGDHVHVSTHAVLNGSVTVGNSCFIGSNAVITHGKSICDEVVVGAGTVIVQDIVVPGTYVGNPAHLVVSKSEHV